MTNFSFSEGFKAMKSQINFHYSSGH